MSADAFFYLLLIAFRTLGIGGGCWRTGVFVVLYVTCGCCVAPPALRGRQAYCSSCAMLAASQRRCCARSAPPRAAKRKGRPVGGRRDGRGRQSEFKGLLGSADEDEDGLLDVSLVWYSMV